MGEPFTDTDGDSNWHNKCMSDCCNLDNPADRYDTAKWDNVLGRKWCKTPFAIKPEKQREMCRKFRRPVVVEKFPEMNSLFELYDSTIEEFWLLPMDVRNSLLQGEMTLPEEARYDFLRNPILGRIAKDEVDQVFDYLRSMVRAGHMVEVAAKAANLPIGKW